MSTASFVLTSWDFSKTMDTSGALPGIPIPNISANAHAFLEIDLSGCLETFKFQTDSGNVIDANTADIRYFTYRDAWNTYIASTASQLGNAQMHTSPGASEIASAGIDNVTFADDKRFVCHDFVRYLASELFNTHFGVDLFNNELAMLYDIRTQLNNGYYEVVDDKLQLVDVCSNELSVSYSDAKYTTDANTSTSNICRELMLQMLSTFPARFSDLPATSIISLPFQENDEIVFTVTIQPHPQQHEIVGLADALASRSYAIHLVLKSSPSNVAQASDEGA